MLPVMIRYTRRRTRVGAVKTLQLKPTKRLAEFVLLWAIVISVGMVLTACVCTEPAPPIATTTTPPVSIESGDVILPGANQEAVIGSTLAPTEPGGIVFHDANLETVIRSALGKLSDEVMTAAELAELTQLNAGSRSVANLSGIEYCVNLEILYLDDNQISDISPLASLTKLTKLFLWWNQIADISFLASLTDLTWINLEENQISDISPLASLTELVHLTLGKNQISDISPLISLNNLTWLSLWGNQISDISPLVANNGLGEGDDVWLGSNALDLSPGSEDMINLEKLEGRGVLIDGGLNSE